jgi:hypothetical protein
LETLTEENENLNCVFGKKKQTKKYMDEREITSGISGINFHKMALNIIVVAVTVIA